MKHMLVLMLCCCSPLLAQESGYRTETLEDIHIKFELPESVWSEAQVKHTKSESVIYTYTRQLGKEKKAPQASLSVLVEHIRPSTSISAYSMQGLKFFQQQNGFRILKTLTDRDGKFTLPYTVGYDAQYRDASGALRRLFILHTIEFNHGAQVLIDFPEEVFEAYEEERDALLHSFRLER